MDPREQQLIEEILERTRELVRLRLRSSSSAFVPGTTPVPYAGRVHDEREVEAGVRSMLDFWLTLGPEGEAMAADLASYLGVRACVLTNSGSSANLVAISALTSPKLRDRRLHPGDEVITAAAGFPTTVAPIIQARAVPVFIDCDPVTGNIRVDRLASALKPGRTRAVMVAHSLGNPFDLGEVTRFCKEHGLWLIEDNCDALGSRYDGRLTGTFGDLSTQSFYPPHHVTMGEGGSVNVVREPVLRVLAESFRDWGRDCWCESGKSDTCGKRHGWQLGELPFGYDHKYVYSHLGFNLKPTDPQAAVGRVQLQKLPAFIEARRRNWETLRAGLAELEDVLEFSLPTHATAWSRDGFTFEPGKPRVEPSWFGFLLRVRPEAPIDRTALARALMTEKVDTRMLFGGNLLRQPAFLDLAKDAASRGAEIPYRVVGDLSGADDLLERALFLGVFPGLDGERLAHVVAAVHRAMGR